MRSGELGFWWRSLGPAPSARPALAHSIEADVAIVGAGFTGLWSAYYLKRANPSLRIVVLEAEVAGFGASGRNGGWVSGFFSGPPRVYERRRVTAGYPALQRAMFETVDEIGRFLESHDLAADFVKGGQLTVALSRAQLRRLREHVRDARAQGVEHGDLLELAREELDARVRVAGALGGTFTPHVASVHPVKLVTALVGAVEGLGVTIYEGTAVSAIHSGRAETRAGAVTARWVLRATEGYTASLEGERRALVPMNSSMVITEPLPAAAWDEIGWRGAETLSDGAHVYAYLQRTADGRIAIGGRGVPYRFRSRTDGRGDPARETLVELRAKLLSMFPALAGAELDHAWSGVLGVPRDWCMSVAADAGSGLAWAGGYVGEGVAASNLAGRTLRDLMLGESTALTALPWVARRPPRWEPEPLRWAAIHGVYALYRRADRLEARGDRPSRLGHLVDRASGRV